MSERVLLVRSASTPQYVILGTDFPCARVFSTASASLVSVLKPSQLLRSPLSTISLTAVAVSSQKATRGEKDVDVTFAAAGLTNGCVLLHNITSDTPLGEILVSITHSPVVAVSIAGGFLWCLTSDDYISVVRLSSPESGVIYRFPSQSNASAIAVVLQSSTPDERVFDVLAAGPTTSAFTVSLYLSAHMAEHHTSKKHVSFASQGCSPTFAWLSTRTGSGSRAAVTASPQDSTLRIWNVGDQPSQSTSTEGAAAFTARCRRTLICGQRFADVCVLEGKSNYFITATTFTGAVLLWDLGSQLLPTTPEPFPLSPHVILYSSNPVGRLLLCQLLPFSAGSEESRDTLHALLLRGRFALPFFTSEEVGRIPATGSGLAHPQQHQTRVALLSSLAMTSASVVLKDVSVPAAVGDARLLQERAIERSGRSFTGDEGVALDALDQMWGRKSVSEVANETNVTTSQSFVAPRVFRAPTTADLPIKQLTLEQRVQDVVKRKNSDEGLDIAAPRSLGLATVPLYQALHANDVAAVMEILNLASRSEEGIRATVMSLQLPYCLQLLSIISERLGITTRKTGTGAHSNEATMMPSGSHISTRSPLLKWIGAIILHRGMEMREVELNGTDEAGNEASSPKDFVAPILHHYREMTQMSDTVATLYGRMGVFLGVRPSEKNCFVNRSRKMLSSNIDMGKDTGATGMLQNDLSFPIMFAEVAAKRGNYTVRVRRAAASRKKSMSNAAMLREAEAAAVKDAKQPKKSLLDEDDSVWDDMAQSGEMNLDELEELGLDEEDSDDDGAEKDEMLADDEEDVSEVDSDEDDVSHEDEEATNGEESEGEESDEETDSSDEGELEALRGQPSDDDDEEDDEVDEEMSEMLNDASAGRRDRREKRVRID